MAVSTVIFFGLALFCTKGVHADDSFAALAARMRLVEKELTTWKSTVVNSEVTLINKFEVLESSLKEEITETVIPPLIKPLVKQAIADNLNEDYIGNVISGHVIDEVQSLKANIQNTKTQLVAITQGLRRVEQERGTYRKRFRKLLSRLNKDIRATQLQLNQTEADLRDARSLKSELRQTNNDLSNTQQKLKGLSEDFVTLNTSCVLVKHEVESCTDGLQEFRLKLRTDFQSITTKLNETNEDLLDTKRVIHGLSEDFVTLNTSCVMVKHEVESCTDGLQEFRLKLRTDFQSITTKLNETNEDLLDTKRVIHGLSEDFVTLNTSCVMVKHEVESCTDGLQEFRLKLRTDFQSITTKLNETNEDLLDTKRVIHGLSEDFVTLNTSCVMVKHEVESCTDGLQEFRLKLRTDFQSITTKLNETNEDLLDTKRVIHGLSEDFVTLNTSCVMVKHEVESCTDGLQEFRLKLRTDFQSITTKLNETNEDLLDTKRVIHGLSEDFVTLNTSCVMVKHEVESCTDGLQEFRLKLRTDFQSITTKLNETNEDLLDTKRVIHGLSEDFVTLNTSCVMVKHEVESCTDGLQEFRLKLPTDFQSITTKLNETNEDLLDTKRVIHGLTEDLITLNISCGLKKDVKPSERNSLASSSFSQVPLRASTTTYPETTAASTDPIQDPSQTVPPVPGTTQDADQHASPDPSQDRTLSTTVPPVAVTTQDPNQHATPSPVAGRDLYRASWHGDLETVRRIVAAGGVDVNYRGDVSRTPVMVAAYRGRRDVVEFLVDEGADLSLVDEVGDNVLHHACGRRGDLETVKLIVSLDVVDINSRGQNSRTPVMMAARNGNRDVVEFLVGAGADTSLFDKWGSNILHLACWGGDLETVKLILDLDVVDINARDNHGWTAADVARDRGHQRVLNLLVSRGGTLSSG